MNGEDPGPPPDASLGHNTASHLTKHFGRFQRRSGAGPSGSQYEHWAGLQGDREGAPVVARVLA